jgi:hypothetical protein
MQTPQRTSLMIMAVLLAVTACVIPNVTFTDPMAQATIMAVTINAAIRETAQAAPTGSMNTCSEEAQALCKSATPAATASQTPSPTITPPPTDTPTPSITPTPIVIASPTSIAAMISVSVATNCRSGPGKAYPIEGALLVDEVAQVLGNDPTGDYWYIPNPDEPGNYCWVWGEYATITGFTGNVQMLTPPPTPTATLTPTPSPGFDVDYVGLVGCSGSWWTRMDLQNSGSLTFRSVEFVLIDIDLDIEDADESDGFVDRSNCSSSSSQVSLAPGDSARVSSPNMSNDPTGHKMRARIKLCSKTGLSGQCVTEVFNFKP